MNYFKRFFLFTALLIKTLGGKAFKTIKFVNLKTKWYLKNANNKTFPVKYFPINLVNVGDHSYGPIDIYTYGAKDEGLQIGKYCSIARDVKFILGGNHKTDCFMTFPVKNKFGGANENVALTKGKITIGDDVWIGVGSIILSGVKLGQGCVVAAGSVVTKSFGPYTIIGGNPSKIIKMRFEENIIKILEKHNLKIGAIESNEISNNIARYSDTLNEKNIQDLINHLKK
ncbi:acetyltransferase [Flavobacterium cheongpyeongense]|uniref:Acetyltransferase n=1 Tax=Flavobacterium cheongpyeongense TaxID=2212651 RepID=A0A2V4BSF5_9FLAO|nr:CatB-related O-acetyltransferase [Flavobacterium cheongpyeongense]PXY41988.1 acetyltransferase [Flavobacterium cheongpyeongense]